MIAYGSKFGIVLFIAAEIILFFYCLTLYKLLKKVPRENNQFPTWFVWIFLIPVVGLIFEWIMLPFGIPNTLKKHFSTNQDAIAAANMLFKLGLAEAVFSTMGMFIPVPPVNDLAALFSLIAMVCYWVLAVKFKKAYLA